MDAAGQRIDADVITFELVLLAAEGGGATKVRQGLEGSGLGFGGLGVIGFTGLRV